MLRQFIIDIFDDALRRGLSLVMNVELSDRQWDQGNLLVHIGGLGVRSASMLASSAFLASAAATLPLQNGILSKSVQDEEDPAMRSTILVWKKISHSSIPANALKHIQKAWDSPVTVTVYQKLLADSCNTPIDAARLRAVASKHAGDWLHAAPITAVGLRPSDEAIRVAVSHHLGCTTCQPHTCICGMAVNAKRLHGLSCRNSSPCQIRHAQLNDIVWRAVKKRNTRQ